MVGSDGVTCAYIYSYILFLLLLLFLVKRQIKININIIKLSLMKLTNERRLKKRRKTARLLKNSLIFQIYRYQIIEEKR